MIIVRLIGGLGNQMFQYAAARRAAYVHSTTLKLDISAFNWYKLRKYSLNHFNIIENIATADDIAQFKGQIIKQNFFHFNPDILKVPKDVYLDGYWQSEKYFADIEDIIRKEFRTKYELYGKNKELASYIQNCTSVSLHIRRGDYVSDPQTNSVHGTCTLDYYQRCISKLLEKITDPHFFIFSDDPKWVIANLHLDYPTTFVIHNGLEKDFEDLRLMSMCKHNIICNSSFSWWGAWLNANPGKMIFAPDQWFRSEKLYTGDLMPSTWQRI